MPYKNVVFIQMQKRLLNDPRWYMMSNKAQLLLIKIWLALSHFDNRLTKDEVALISILRYDLPLNEMKSCLAEIKTNFPNFKGNKHFYYWKKFEEYTNYIPKRKSLGNPKEIPRKEHIDIDMDIDIDKERKKKTKPLDLSDSEFLESLKTNPVYKHVDLNHEFQKMDIWITNNPGRKKTRRFIVNWLNKIERPVTFAPKPKPKADPHCDICIGKGRILDGPQKGAQCLCVK